MHASSGGECRVPMRGSRSRRRSRASSQACLHPSGRRVGRPCICRPRPSSGRGSSSPARRRPACRDICKRRAIVRSIAGKAAPSVAQRTSTRAPFDCAAVRSTAKSRARLTRPTHRPARFRCGCAVARLRAAAHATRCGAALPGFVATASRAAPRVSIARDRRDQRETNVSRGAGAAMQCDPAKRMCYKAVSYTHL